MTVPHGKDSYFAVDDGGGAVVDISDRLDDASSSASRDTAETSAFGNSNKQYIAGLRDGTISVSGHFDSDAGKVHQVLSAIYTNDTPQDFEFGPEGNTSGDTLISGQCFLTSYEVSSSVSDKVSVSAEFQVTGGLSYGSFA